MRGRVLLLLFLLAGCRSATPAPEEAAAADREAIRRVVAGYVDRWGGNALPEIGFVDPDSAVARVTWERPGTRVPAGEATRAYRGVLTMVLVRRQGEWRMVALEDTVGSLRPDPWGATVLAGSLGR